MNRVWTRAGLVVAVLAAISTFSVVVSGRSWWGFVAAVVVAVGLVGAVVRPWWARLPLHAAVVLAGLALVLRPSHWEGALREAASIIWIEAPPVIDSVPIVAVMVVGLGLVAAVLELLLDTRWGPWWLAVGLVMIVAIPTALMAQTPPLWLLVVMAVAWLIVLGNHGERPVEWRFLGAATVATVAVSALVYPLIPAPEARVWNVGGAGPGAFASGVNPMLELGRDLQRGPDRPVLEYTSTRTTSSYLKLATLDDFSGETWEPREFPTSNAWREELGEVESTTHRLDLQMLELESRRVPIPARSTAIAGLADWWTWMRPGGTAQLASGSVDGEDYRVDFEVPDLSLEQLRAATTRERVDVAMLRLPRSPDLPTIEAIAQEVTANATTDYDRAIALQDWFRSEFDYSETTPVTENYDGNGFEHVVTFLEERSGYCIHFASAMAIMGRTVGLPTRVAVGYAPADSMSIRDGSRTWTNRSHDAHAWVEVHFDEIGWITFDPTASVGTATSFASELTDTPDADTPDATPTTDAPDPTTPDDVDAPTATDETTTEESNSGRWLAVLAIVVAVGGAAPAVARVLRRRVRGSGPLAVWREVTDTAIDLRIDVPRTLTVGETVALLEAHGAPSAEIRALGSAVEQSRYAHRGDDRSAHRGGDQQVESVAAADVSSRSIRRGLLGASRRRDRLMASLMPRSLLRWR